MAETDWNAICQEILDTKTCYAVITADTEGNVYYAAPLDDGGNFQYNLYGGAQGDAYEAEVTQEDGSKKSESVDEVNNLLLVLKGEDAKIPTGHGVRINGTKYMKVGLKVENETYKAPCSDGVHDIKVKQTHHFKKGSEAACVLEQGEYVVICLCDASKPEQQSALAANAAAGAFYWLFGE